MEEKTGLIKKRTDIVPTVPTFPKIDKMHFKLPGLPNEIHTSQTPKKFTVFNEEDLESLVVKNRKIRAFDADYLNQVNTKRLDDL